MAGLGLSGGVVLSGLAYGRQGGHNIPEPTIRRRFEAGLRLLAEVYQPLVDQWVVYDNAGDEPVLVDWSEKR